MFYSIKRYCALFLLIGSAGSLPVLANPLKASLTKKAETFIIDIQGKKRLPAINKIVNLKESHKFQLNLQPGEKAAFTLRSDKAISLKLQTPVGVKEISDEKYIKGVLAAPGDYEFEISSDDIALYSLEISGN